MSEPVIVFDNGSGYLKAGLSSKETPMFTLPALIGRPMLRYKQKIENIELRPIMIGDEVTPVRSNGRGNHYKCRRYANSMGLCFTKKIKDS